MTINTQEILNVVTTLATEKNLQVAIKETCKGALMAAAGTLIGGLTLGPVGMAIGGTLGAVTAAAMSSKFRPVAHIIMYDMTVAQRESLAISMSTIFSDFNIEDATLLLPLLLNNQAAQAAILSQLSSFIQSEMNMQIAN